jgi:predicted ATP-grasp superfamily ATP-dependent carboligase
MNTIGDQKCLALTRIRNFIVVGEVPGLIVQVLQAIRTFSDAECIVLCPPGTGSLRLTNMTRECIYVGLDGNNDESVISAINRLAELEPNQVAIPSDCTGSRVLDRIRDRVKATLIPMPNASMLECFDDKWRFYEFCKKHGLNVPPTQLNVSKDKLDFPKMALELGLPFVIKPLNQQGSSGVRVIHSADEYRQKILNDDIYQFAPLIAQQYIEGVDVGVNLLSIHGRVMAIAVQQRAFPQRPGAKIEFMSNSYLENAAETICKASGYHGVMNIDARIEKITGKVFLFESNPRFWVSLSASVWCGLNFVHACLDADPSTGKVIKLNSGTADTHYHPMFRPALWAALFSRQAYRRRMAKVLILNLWTLCNQTNSVWRKMQTQVLQKARF